MLEKAQPEVFRQMHRLTLTLEPSDGRFPVPFSTGYQTYASLLSVLDDGDLADDIHDTPFASLTNSGLLGSTWGRADREYHRTVRDDKEYRLRLGIVHPDDEALFEALVRAFVIEDEPLSMAHGKFTVRGVESETTSHDELLAEAAEAVDDGATGVQLHFETATCRQRFGNVYDAHPERVSLFRELARRWNGRHDGPERLSPTEKALGESLYVTPESDQYRTRSIVVHRREPDGESPEAPAVADGGNAGDHLTQAQGFTGKWTFGFKDASEATKTAVIALARFAEFAGVGRHTARGAGTVTTEVKGI